MSSFRPISWQLLCILVPLLVSILWVPPAAFAVDGVLDLEGSIVFWQRPICAIGLQCSQPAPISAPVPVTFEFSRPAAIGATLVADRSFSAGTWSVEISMVWVNPPAKGAIAQDSSPSFINAMSAAVLPAPTALASSIAAVLPPITLPASTTATSYIVTQLRLSEVELGVVAECTRYDAASDVKFLMPGSCSGRGMGETVGQMFGVSTLSTR